MYIYCNQTRFTFAHLHHVRHFRPEHYISLWGEYAAGVLVIAFLVFLSLLYLKGNTKPFGEEFQLERLHSFLEKWDSDTDSGLAFLRDKRFFWYQEEDSDQVVFQFAQERNKIVVMSEPIGNPDAIDQAIVACLAQAKEASLEVLFYEVGQETTLTLHEHGYEFMKFGERAMVDLVQFNIDGKHGRKYRAVIHRLEKQGYAFQVLQPLFDDKMLTDLKKISDSWLQRRQEKGFSLGFFAEDYLQEAPLALVTNADKELVAFANTMPGRHDKVGSVDLMRYDRENAPDGVMDYLFVNLFLHFQAQGKHSFDLGMAPLANVGQLESSFLQERIAFFIYNFTNRFYSFSGLRAYKSKFNPSWQAKYVAYPKRSWLVINMLSIYQIDNRQVEMEKE